MNHRIKIRVEGKKNNYLIEKLIEKKINLYNIEEKDKYLELIIDKKDYELIKEIKTIKSLKIMKYYGLERIHYLMKKYSILQISIIIGIILNMFLSNLILKIDIGTPNKSLEKTVKKDLELYGIKKYRIKKSYEEIQIIKDKLLQKENDRIEWIEIESIGTKYIVTVEEKKHTQETTCSPRNIVAKKNAVITKIESSSGEITKKKLDYVSKGEVVISGTIHNKEEEVSIKCAEGKVYGETWYKVTSEIPVIEHNIEKKDNYKWKLVWNFNSKTNSLSNNKWIIKKQYNILESKFFPLDISIIHYQEIKRTIIKNDLKTIDSKAYNKSLKVLEDKLKAKPTVLRKNILKKSLNNSKIIIEVFYAIEEDITEYQEIPKNEPEEG